MADSNTYRAFALFVQGERVLNCTEYTPVESKMILRRALWIQLSLWTGEWRKCQPVLKSLAPILV